MEEYVEKKLSMYSRRWRLAEKFNLEKTKVRTIIDTYIEMCREDLLSGHIVQIFGLVKLVPDNAVDDFVATTAWYSKRLAKDTSIPYNTILCVLKKYQEDMRDELLSGKNVTIPRLASLFALQKGDGYVVHSRISETIHQEISQGSRDVTGVRAHSSKLLRQCISAIVREDEEAG